MREHYDMLTGAAPGDESDSPYAIEDDEYQIEIIETPPGGGEATTYMEPVDEGWALDDPEPSRTIEMEADEPPPVSFEDATREYIGTPKRETIDPGVAEFSDSPDSNPVGFSQQTTNIKPRNLGFVKPTEDPKPPADEQPARARPKTAPPELKMSLRTPSTPPGLEPRSDPALRPPPVEERTSYQPAPIDAPMIQVSYESAPPPDTSPKYQPRTISVELPAHLGKAPTIDIAMTTAPTTDLKPSEIPEGKLTRELVERETAKIPLPLLTKKGAGEVAGSPTRELGLREKALSKAPTTPLPMKELLKEAKSAGDEDTRTSAPPAFDPFDVRNAAILDEIDQGAPKDEAKDDRTRRRITSLLDRAADWHRQGENDRAVTAVDLALGEDPNSALAQKLIHRNRDTIMTVFQGVPGRSVEDADPVAAATRARDRADRAARGVLVVADRWDAVDRRDAGCQRDAEAGGLPLSLPAAPARHHRLEIPGEHAIERRSGSRSSTRACARDTRASSTWPNATAASTPSR